MVGGVLLAGTKGVNGMVWVNRAVRGGGWCVVGWYQGCKWYGVGKQNGEGWCGVLFFHVLSFCFSPMERASVRKLRGWRGRSGSSS